MKKHINFLLSLAVAVGLGTSFTGCTPDSYDMPGATVSPSELVEGIAFSVTPDPKDPNTIHLKSLMAPTVQAVWDTPNGVIKAPETILELPFSGEYSVKFGVTSTSGPVWGEPYVFTVNQNNFEMLSNPLWTYLAGGVDENGQGNPKVWVPMNKAYPPYQGSSPVGYMSPTDVLNDGSNNDDPVFGPDGWKMNWDPGFQSWLIPSDSPYLDTEMVLELDPLKGCVATIDNVAEGGSIKTGKFTFNVSDPKHPTISFTGCEMLHANWGNGICSNYTTDLKILECTPYVLQIATMRTNSEGPWWIVWNFVAKDLRDGIIQIPVDDPGLLPEAPVQEPAYEDLETSLFTISGADASYVATKTTFLLDEEKPYDLMWWNPATAEWQWLDCYGASWAPKYEAAGDFALTLEKTGSAELETVDGNTSAKFTIQDNKIVFDKEITLLKSGDISITGTEFTVMVCKPDDNEVVFGIPVEKDANGDANKYLCARMTIKPIGGGQTGPVVIPVDNSLINVYVEADKYLRLNLWQPLDWGGTENQSVDVNKLKLKKNQKLVLKYTVSGIDWTGSPKAAFCCNIPGFEWEPGCFSNFQAYDFNTTGENTMELVNDTGSTFNFATAPSAFTVTIQLDGFAASNDISNVSVNVSSLTIE